MTAHGTFHWNELMTHDVAKAKTFYAQTLGWTFEDVPMPGMDTTYTLIRSDGEMVSSPRSVFSTNPVIDCCF